jgi:uncharacterized protein (DUF1697 family)
MAIYVALLRAVNVGGRIVKMAELTQLFEGMGFARVQTYIQSGNVLFDTDETDDGSDEEELRERIESEIAAHARFPVAVVLRTPDELEQMIAHCPFADEAASSDKRLYVAALDKSPASQGIERLKADYSGDDEWRVVGRELYLLYHNGAGESKLTTAFLERRLGVTATARNWRTLTTLARMARERA